MEKIGASSEKDEMAQKKQNIINREHVLGTTKTIFVGEQSTGNINTLETDLAEDVYIGKKTQSKEDISKDQESKEDKEITFSMEESEANSDDEEDQFKPIPKLGRVRETRRGSRGARGKLGRGRSAARGRGKASRTITSNEGSTSKREEQVSIGEPNNVVQVKI